jgi:hypothetical protein
VKGEFMIDVKQAVIKAVEYLGNFYDAPIEDVRLEEVERTADERFWLITLGFIFPASNKAANGLGTLFASTKRTYKVIKINTASGDFVSMKIREAEVA